jgi:hypothetical protein
MVHSVRRHVIACALVVACAVAGSAVGADAPAPAASATALKQGASAAPVKLVDINSASRSQLKTLSGIGDAEADKIIAGRPYLSKVHLVTEAGLPLGVYLSIRRQIVAVQNDAARAKLKTLASAQQAQPR